MFYLDAIGSYLYPHLFVGIEKTSSRGHALEHLESSDTHGFMSGLIVCKLCKGKPEDYIKIPQVTIFFELEVR